MVGKKLRNYNEKEQEGFYKIFSSDKYRKNSLFESIASKLYRHEYAVIGHDLVEETIEWFKENGLELRIVDEGNRFLTEIELV